MTVQYTERTGGRLLAVADAADDVSGFLRVGNTGERANEIGYGIAKSGGSQNKNERFRVHIRPVANGGSQARADNKGAGVNFSGAWAASAGVTSSSGTRIALPVSGTIDAEFELLFKRESGMLDTEAIVIGTLAAAGEKSIVHLQDIPIGPGYIGVKVSSLTSGIYAMEIESIPPA